MSDDTQSVLTTSRIKLLRRIALAASCGIAMACGQKGALVQQKLPTPTAPAAAASNAVLLK
jgi:hypothetical protein